MLEENASVPSSDPSGEAAAGLASDARPPLAVHVVWHGVDFGEPELAHDVYHFIARNPLRPLHRGLGVPVWLWSNVEHARRGLAPGFAQRTAVVPLVGPGMLLDGRDYLDELRAFSETAGSSVRVLPVSLAEGAFRSSLAKLNFIRLHTLSEPARIGRFRGQLVHELCRLMLGRSPIGAVASDGAPRPVRLFISHAKHDGLQIAEELRDHVRRSHALDTFFDANDIAPGYEFAKEIEAGIESAVLVVVQTDEYASREWCRREVLIAKQHGRPIVVINTVRTGEERSFPYLGNVPTVRWDAGSDSAERCERVITLALRELLRVLYFAAEMDAAGIRMEGDHVSAYPPELCTVAVRQREGGLSRILYADPPLGDEEASLLRAVAPDVETSTLLLLERNRLSGRIVALSISESPDMAERGWAEPQLLDFMVELARYLLASGAALAYGGDLRGGGFTEGLIELARAHDAMGAESRVHVFLYWPYHQEKLSRQREADLAPAVRFHRMPRPDGVAETLTLATFGGDPAAAARCLTAMREEMTRQVHARVLIGGRVEGFLGRYPGVAEEALLALEAGQPLFLVSAFGGAAEAVIRALAGEPSLLSGVPDGAELVEALRARGTAALNNGLNEEENRELFTTPVLRRAVQLVLLGLGRLNPRPQAT